MANAVAPPASGHEPKLPVRLIEVTKARRLTVGWSEPEQDGEGDAGDDEELS